VNFFNDRLFIFILENKGVDLTLYDAFKSFCEICLRGCDAINREMIAASVCYFALVKLKYKSRLIWEAHPDIIKFLDLGDFSRYPEVINLGVQIYNDFYMINHKLLEEKNALKKVEEIKMKERNKAIEKKRIEDALLERQRRKNAEKERRVKLELAKLAAIEKTALAEIEKKAALLKKRIKGTSRTLDILKLKNIMNERTEIKKIRAKEAKLSGNRVCKTILEEALKPDLEYIELREKRRGFFD